MASPERFVSMADLINYHLEVHEGMELVDIYKLVYQMVFGPEHLGDMVSEEAIAREMLEAGTDSKEPLLEPISVDGISCRMNLRRAKKLGIAPGLIAEAVGRSVERFSRDRTVLVSSWDEIGRSLPTLAERFTAGQFEAFSETLRRDDYPPVHHSSTYRRLNHPAYRVLVRPEIDRLMRNLPARDRSP